MQTVDGLSIGRDATIAQALRQLEAAGTKTLLVVDHDGTLIGTLTDGDVRRWILGAGGLDGSVDQACHREPYAVLEGHDREAAKRAMLEREIQCIPVVDPTGRVRGVLLWNELFAGEAAEPEREPLGLPVVIMAGGAGTRMAPFTSVLPKPLIPVDGKTMLERIIDTFTAHGVDDFHVSVHYKSHLIKAFFEELAPAYQLRYLYEREPLGTAGALSGLVGQVDGDLVVTNCDVIVRADFHELVRQHRERGNDATLVVSLKNYRIPYGVCDIENGELLDIREKPEFDLLVNTGLYVLRSSVLELIPKGRHFHITDLIAAVQQNGGRVGVFPISDTAWIDTGEWAEYRAAVAALSSDRRKSPR